MKLAENLQPILLELSTLERRLATAGAKTTETPEQAELNTLRTELDQMRSAASAAQMAVDDMENEILRIQDDERKLRARDRDNKAQLATETDEEKRKDLQHDRYATKSRIADLMAELMEAHNEVHALRQNRDIHGAKISDLERKVEVAARAAEAASTQESEDPRAHVAELEAQLPDDVVEAYHEQRAVNGVGVGLFNGRTCGSCHIVLPAADRSAINLAPADELPECPDCGSYLVRKAV
ncbi:zinc ribbon domain-containing protein [Corynebacterium renale]|uniref:zinc ribbon domain-containing protein n=1 Tax=Corynebacterium renale TaxID=1724 RepID=UPI000E00DFE5|nr:C4-type zinc ribbon domain-containing protein [Corynebacterium renale]STC97331.1 Zn-ribbon protein [Corynebacterium renale]